MNAGNVLTNAPAYPEQLAYAKKFEAVNVKTDDSLTGMPGGYTSPDRLARGSILTRNMPVPLSTQEALYQADFVISSLTVPYLNIPGAGSRSNTIWKVLKDLDHQIVYIKNSVYFQGGKKIAPLHVANSGYTIIDLSVVDFKTVPIEYIDDTIQPTPKERVKRIITANDLPEFGE
jgi:penicillin V acylase-like amidase (Ntn superfamily)